MKELDYLIPETKDVLINLSKLDLITDYTFVGGSALAVLLQHRLSEDLDFFTWKADLSPIQITETLKKSSFTNITPVELSNTQADFIIDNVKVSFFANDWDILKSRKRLINNLHIASLETLVVMKINTLFMRARYRDYYDLYILHKNVFSLEKMYELAKSVHLNMNRILFQKALTFTRDIYDEDISKLKLSEKIDIRGIEDHFVNSFKVWNEEISNKE
ncbi:MAG: nucleotidyl transferase AbiEii/AbiGii toxin family protein [Bacteroidales bacterium]